jgi:hypothetical protein
MRDTIDMARESGGYPAAATDRALLLFSESHLERFAALVRADERTRFTVSDAITDNSESPEYRAGWNDCRAEMLKGQP